VRATLRLGAYQLLFLRIPDHAAVSEAVALVADVAPRAKGLVNAVLRSLVRQGPPAFPDPENDPLGWLTTAGSIPAWLAERWIARLGPSVAVARARAFLETPPFSYRLNPRVPDAALRAEAAGLAPRPLAVPGAWEATAGRPAELAASGVLYLQDEGAQLVAHLAAGPGLRLDACAAPGGKSTLMADRARGTGLVVAAEASTRRLRTLAGVCARWGATNVAVVGADARHPPFRADFEGVLLDAPCSGLGTLGRHPDIRWRARREDLARQGRRQRELLEALAPLVRPGGTLIYATCSVEEEENEAVIEPFLAEHPEFEPLPLTGWTAAFADGPYVRTRPEHDRGDAFFAALLGRN
jgi:16S rRNA (cytosine967-C5)-methyltransferase